ncbi:hypothetical protein SAMN04487947_2744 [Halogeometricum rufum]|mgnify:CR=1 FL=1|uniref:Halobacterial output domain-containing protein n=1 Tax=Halogeometricum rufum TaxID=553469 RepID=A0A1I6I1B9_9EURY|nr:HalOD1 output domain-containing protein [Halogeometricum rufum]SFR60522.1 hypothetical protein SAMN04487947_2744 [Halogeometricum rufum]
MLSATSKLEVTQLENQRTNRSSEPVGVRVVNEVARRTNRDPRNLPILADCVDPDALDALVSSGPPALSVQFRYAGLRVVVGGDGRIEMAAPPASDGTLSE